MAEANQSRSKGSSMPIDANSPIEVTAYRWVPQMARGYVKDLRVRWALEEIGVPYRVRLVGGVFGKKEAGHLADQPFGQVPVYKENGLTLFESGAILVHIGSRDERLLPNDPVARARAIGWAFAALNSVEPFLQTLFLVSMVADGKTWKEEAVAAVSSFPIIRLKQLESALCDREWLEGQFTIGDLLMIDVLRSAPDEAQVSAHPSLVAYIERGTSRPAFKAAMAAHLADFDAGPLST